MAALERLALGAVMASFAGPAVPAWLEGLLADGLGSVCLFASNLPDGERSAREVTTTVHARAPQCLVAVDEEGGDVTRLDVGTGSPVPSAAALGAVDDVALTRAVAAGLGARLGAGGVDLDLAPVLDVNTSADNPVIGVRSFGAEPSLVARHGVAAVAGLQGAGVAACAKHFPGHGDTSQDSHVAAPRVLAPRELLAARELLPFAAAVDDGVAAVMTAHVVVPALDAEQPASTSPAVTRLLREELGFRGVVVTDALDMVGVSGPQAHGSLGAAAVAALRAGADLLCLNADGTEADVRGVLASVSDAVQRGDLPRARLAEASARVAELGYTAAARRSARPLDRRTLQAAADGAGAEVAGRALRVEGPLPPVAGALVVRLLDAGNVAAAARPAGVGPALAHEVRGVELHDARDSDDVADVLARAAGRPLVLVARDLHRRPAAAAWVARLAAARPDAVLVDMGWPAAAPPAGLSRVVTYGAAAASADAAARLLAGAGR